MAHKGGAWKVAYADFVTAMMALFMVLWILGTEQEFLEQLQEYFRNPPNPFKEQAAGVLLRDGELALRSSPEDNPEAFFDRVDPQLIANLVRDFYRLLNLDPEDDERPVHVHVTSDGLQLVLFDRSRQPLFEKGTEQLTDWGNLVMQNLSWILARHRFKIMIAGHTAPVDDDIDPHTDKWTLSLRRADEVRTRLRHYAVSANQFDRVSGYADTRPYEGLDPENEAHRRVTLSLGLEKPFVETEDSQLRVDYGQTLSARQ